MRRLLIIVSIIFSINASAQIHIWRGTNCNADNVVLQEFLPSASPKAAIIICPGGSYFWHDMVWEGAEVAKWLASEGYASYLLNYRVAGVVDFITAYRVVFGGNKFPDMLCDLQRSIDILRQKYPGLAIGTVGFSAGGHLVLSSGAYSGTDFLRVAYGMRAESSLRPDFIAALYPVVTMSDERFVHKRSRRGLLGETGLHSALMRDSLSIENHIPDNMPPVFLANCIDDSCVDWRNSALLDSALNMKNVPHDYLKFNRGGHGFGVNPSKLNIDTYTWKKKFIHWLESNPALTSLKVSGPANLQKVL